MVKNPLDINWAEVVDILASEYGWTIDYIRTLDLGQIISLLKAVKLRYKKQDKAIKESTDTNNPSADELSISDFKAMGGQERVREDGRKEIVL